MSERLEPAQIEAATERLAAVTARVEAACRRAGRDPDTVTIVGACKRQPLERIAAAVAAGLAELGGNYVQEAREIRPALDDVLAAHGVEPPRWRMIGHLQRNKVRAALDVFEVIDTVDRVSLAREIDKRVAPSGRIVDVCLQINTSGEAQKSGVPPDEAAPLLAGCSALPHLRVVGLMTMPEADPVRTRAAFAQLRALRDTLRGGPGGEVLDALSMGMSGDFEEAIEEGATHVRLGTVLFGERTPA